MQNIKVILLKLLLVTLFLFPAIVSAQFYNGHQMTFGKNRVQYNDFYWQYYRFQRFDTYFYVGGNKIAEYVSRIADEEIERLEYAVEEILQRRIIFIVYNKQSEFKQSNIGLVTGNEEYNIGGVVRIVDNKVFLYYEGDHQKLKKQVQASIVEILVNEMLYGGSFRSRFKSSVLLNLPEWYTPGLISYFAYDIDFETEEKIKNVMLNVRNRKIHQLHGDVAKYAGHSLWRYIAETYGRETVSNIVYMTRVTKNAEAGFYYVLGMPLKEITNDWYAYYQSRYQNEVNLRTNNSDDVEIIKKRTKKQRIYNQVKISPDGRYIAYASNQDGRYIIWMYDSKTSKTKRVLSRENKIDQITDYSYPILAWHPSGEVLTYIFEQKGHIWLEFYTISTKEKQRREVFYMDKILDYSFSKLGDEIVLSAVDNGYTDIYTYSIVSSTFNRLTKDIADDLHPRFVQNSSKIIFSSNRKTTQLNYKKGEESAFKDYYDLFIYDLDIDNDTLIRLSDTHKINEYAPIEVAKNKYTYLSDESGIVNKYHIAYDSTISFIDTAIHYRTFTKKNAVTNMPFSIKSFDHNTENNFSINFFKGRKRFSLEKKEYLKDELSKPVDLENSWFRSYYNEQKSMDSLMRIEMEKAYEPDSIVAQYYMKLAKDTLIDVNYYIFDVELESSESDITNALLGRKASLFKLPKQLVYFTNFYTNLMVAQVDFGFMNQSYQAYTGSAFYYNPGINLFTKVGAIDLFEDYKITGGIRWSFELTIDEVLVSLDNVKKRLDKSYIFHRQLYQSDFFTQVRSNTYMGVFKYPLTQIYGFKGTTSLRTDNHVFKSINEDGLKAKDELQIWGGLKGEFVFDNTRNMGINVYDGLRMKAFAEYYSRFKKNENSHMFVLGFDVRNYLPIHRDFIFATRVAGSTSFGSSLLIYYLGGVDNWMNFSRNTPTFDNSIEINQSKNWAYQSNATNMRGFVQNVRNGNTFGVINAELRWPIIRYVFNRPISNDFFNNFMLIGFADGGSAWEGMNPWKADNAYDYEPKLNGPVTVIIDRKHSPFIAGVGFGLRSRFLGYYIRTDWAWGIDGGRVMPRVFYLSLSTDF